MSVARVGETRAKEGLSEALRAFLLSIIPIIQSSAGNISCALYQDREDPSRFMMVEIWGSVEAHQASVKNIPPEMIGEILPMLAGSPAGRYYEVIGGSDDQ